MQTIAETGDEESWYCRGRLRKVNVQWPASQPDASSFSSSSSSTAVVLAVKQDGYKVFPQDKMLTSHAILPPVTCAVTLRHQLKKRCYVKNLVIFISYHSGVTTAYTIVSVSDPVKILIDEYIRLSSFMEIERSMKIVSSAVPYTVTLPYLPSAATHYPSRLLAGSYSDLACTPSHSQPF